MVPKRCKVPLGVQEKPRHADWRKLREAHGQTLQVNWEHSKHRPFEVRPRIQWRDAGGKLHVHPAHAPEEEANYREAPSLQIHISWF